jgi:hypothetical protein
VAPDRLADLTTFYRILSGVEERLGGKLSLGDCHGRMPWPDRGVYFFFEEGEHRSDSGSGARVVRVGTHALREGSRTTLWNRLSQHRGVAKSGAGNHRTSALRALVGASMLASDPDLECATWGRRTTAPREVRRAERLHEARVSRHVGSMRLLVVGIDDSPGPASARAYIVRNAVALLSNYDRRALDPPSEAWLGLSSPRESVRRSGLWNAEHVNESHGPGFLSRLEALAEAADRVRR